jgi:hypothetical protein
MADQQFEPHALEDITIHHYNEFHPAPGSFQEAFFRGWMAMKEAVKTSNLECDGKRPMLLPLPHGVGLYLDSLKGGNEDQNQIDKEVGRLRLALSGVLKGYGFSKDHTFLACHVKKLYVEPSVSGA